MPVNPNPQGKASLPLLNELQAWRGAEAPARDVRGLLSDYLRGLLVLSADFSFRPAPGRDCYLYYREGRWTLSLIAPDEWRPHRYDCYVAQCELRRDATWDVKPAADLQERIEVVDALAALVWGFQQRLQNSAMVADSLPHYEASLPYYRRVLASGLARSFGFLLFARMGVGIGDDDYRPNSRTDVPAVAGRLRRFSCIGTDWRYRSRIQWLAGWLYRAK